MENDIVIQRWTDTIKIMADTSVISNLDAEEMTRWVQHGVDLDFLALPEPLHLPNTPAVEEHAPLVRERLQDYIEFGALEILPSDHILEHGIAPLHIIVKNGKKPRLVIDLSVNLNGFLRYTHFRYSTVAQAAAQSKTDAYLGKLDISNCFLSFPINPLFRRYFVIEFEGARYRSKRVVWHQPRLSAHVCWQ